MLDLCQQVRRWSQLSVAVDLLRRQQAAPPALTTVMWPQYRWHNNVTLEVRIFLITNNWKFTSVTLIILMFDIFECFFFLISIHFCKWTFKKLILPKKCQYNVLTLNYSNSYIVRVFLLNEIKYMKYNLDNADCIMRNGVGDRHTDNSLRLLGIQFLKGRPDGLSILKPS